MANLTNNNQNNRVKRVNTITNPRPNTLKDASHSSIKKESSMSVLFGDQNYTEVNSFFREKGLVQTSGSEKLSALVSKLNIKSIFRKKENIGASIKVMLAGVVAVGAMFQAGSINSAAEARTPNRTVKKNSKKTIKKSLKNVGSNESDARSEELKNSLNRNGSRARGNITHRGLSVSRDNNGTIQAGRFIVPAEGQFTSGFGPRWGKFHKGMDIAAKVGTPINAAMQGTVSFTGWQSGYGQVVEISHPNGLKTRYAHCSKINVITGQSVEAGENIANIGMTGHSTGPHVHFEVLANGVQVNPRNYM